VWTSMNREVGYFHLRSRKFIPIGKVPFTPHIFFRHRGAIYFTVYEDLYKITPDLKQITHVSKFSGTRRMYGFRSIGNANYLFSEQGLLQLDSDLKLVSKKYTGYIIRDILETPAGIYAATYGDGLHLLNPDGSGRRIFQDRFGWSSAALSLRYDSVRHRLWLVCNKGIFIIPLNKSGKPGSVNYLLACGSELPCTELNGGDYEVRPDDRYYYFPSNDGLMKIPINWNTDRISKEYLIKSGTSGGNSIDVSDRIYLPAAHKNLILKLQLPFSFHEENEEQEFRLSPLFQQWRPVPENRQLVFSQLPHGTYTLWIRNARGERRLTTIYVSRFWFQEPLFHLTLLIAFIGILFMAIYLRTRTLRRRSEILKRAVEMKTAELKQNLKTLEASQNQLKQETALRENMNSVLMHDIRSPLLFLTQSSYNLNNSLRKRYPNILEPANVLANTVKDLYILSSDYITWLKNRKSGNNPETETLKLYEVLEETLNFYRPIISSGNNSLHFNCAAEDKDKTFCTDGQLLRCVLRNLIDNSNKYTRNGDITVELKHSGQEGIITIYDNGKGLPARILTTFAKRNMENPNLWTLKAMDSEEIGMNMILQFTEIINGKITYERMPNGVSKFQLILNELTCQAYTPPDSSKSMP